MVKEDFSITSLLYQENNKCIWVLNALLIFPTNVMYQYCYMILSKLESWVHLALLVLGKCRWSNLQTKEELSGNHFNM